MVVILTIYERTKKMSNLELNKGDNFIFGLDVSGSMTTTDTPTGQSRIEFAKEKAIAFALEASKWDEDGIDLITFGHKITNFNNVTAETSKQIIESLQANEGSTDTAGLIKAAYARHKEIGSSENTVLFIVTDGAPNDKEAVKQAIINITNELVDEHSFAISFLTVGKIDAGLQAFLTELDDNLKGAKYDIVDVKALEDVDFIAAFVGALHD
jgi:Mg-chelatase subunit ChlD